MALTQPDPRMEYQTISTSGQYAIIYGDFIWSLPLNSCSRKCIKGIESKAVLNKIEINDK